MQRPSACGSRVCVWQTLTWVLNFEGSHQSKPRIMELSHSKRKGRKVNNNEKRSIYIIEDYENRSSEEYRKRLAVRGYGLGSSLFVDLYNSLRCRDRMDYPLRTLPLR
ncbi:hypothetical protein TNIN_432031 [Trichonephila inaurata madagascariensis]|uniref:Uncharacterized protein n=1 Tax=Trichonephila inaurata madagascariensis TaxID=2747483 RepID=A0A8X7CDX4_9ARAC|nr:hypothetical protein TNIN_432031 [Trichonephila inaurata madagascariensis]